MFVESRDILFITLSAGFIVLVVFIALALNQLTRVLKNVGDITDDVSETTHTLKQGFDNLRARLSSYSAFLTSLGPVIKKAVDSFRKKAAEKDKKKSR
jgi:ABC-type transporter Mla subunit MlaD